MDLKTYLSPKTAEQREEFASLCSTSKGHLQNVMYGVRPCAPELAVLIEKHTDGAVTRQELRDDWRAIWPELIAATPSPATVRKGKGRAPADTGHAKATSKPRKPSQREPKSNGNRER